MIRPEKTVNKIKDRSEATISAIGDSLTYGWMVQRGYVDYFEEMLKEKYPESSLTIMNRGIPGDTAHGGLYRVESEVVLYDPDCVLIQFGLNDAFLGCPAEQYKKNIHGIVDKIRAGCDAEIVLVSSVCLIDPRLERMIAGIYDALDEVADERDLPIARVHEYWMERIARKEYGFSDLVQFDGVHPNDRGHRLMGECVVGVF